MPSSDTEMPDAFLPGDGWISDESDYHGTPTKQKQLESESSHVKVPQLACAWRDQEGTRPPVPTRKVLYNEYEGRPDSGRQLGETIPEFLRRMPPLTARGDGSWIWIANPVLNGTARGKGGIQRFELAPFEEAGARLLAQFEADHAAVESANVGKAPSTVSRKLGPYRDRLKDDILAAAARHGVTTGKWMLFPSEQDVNKTWLAVSEAVAADELGTSAKVAVAGPARNHPPQTPEATLRQRLICIYTRDFSDVDDVRRVLGRLVEIGLAPADGRGIYYKCDAYTYLGIESGNPYKLRASLYSGDVLLKMSRPGAEDKAGVGAKRAMQGGGFEGWSF